MSNKKNIILAFGNKEFNKSLIELKNHLDFDLNIADEYDEKNSLEDYQGLIIHEDALKNNHLSKLIKNLSTNKIIFYNSKNIKRFENIEKLKLPASIDQINNIVTNNIIKKEFRTNSSLKINHYKLDKNTRRLMKNDIELELTEKEIELIELLNKKSFTKKKEILSEIWKYSDDADTHTVETHVYRLRKKIKEMFNDDNFIRSEKKGYTI
tara:strand:+ start:46 stop:675 length:630 start_codon:yes stop_codon:yes gene_type:complete